MEFLSLLALVIAVVALLRGAFRTPPAPQVIYIPVPQQEPETWGGCLPLIVIGLVLLVLLGVIQF